MSEPKPNADRFAAVRECINQVERDFGKCTTSIKARAEVQSAEVLLAHGQNARTELSDADARAVKYLKACAVQNNDVCQTLGKALGYPWFKDDQKNFPGATEADGVCVGEHVAGSIADEAAAKIVELKQREAKWREPAKEFCDLLEMIDRRALAADGPVEQETAFRMATKSEARKLYKLAKTITAIREE